MGSNRYGDCKALSNYMMSLLAAAGITSFPVLINAGREYASLNADFPTPFFNHEILCVPSATDTTWLECTSYTNPAGYLGGFTGNRDALMITPSGGRIIHTPSLSGDQSFIRRTIIGSVLDDVTTSIQISATYSGYLHDLLQPFIGDQADDKIASFVSRKFSLPGYTVDSYRYDPGPSDAAVPLLHEQASLSTEGLVSKSDTRLFINMNLAPVELRDIGLPQLSVDPNRKSTFTLPENLVVEDSIVLTLPANYQPESLPKPVSVTQSFGSFVCELRHAGNHISLHRKLTLSHGTYAASLYPAFLSFWSGTRAAANYKAVLHAQ